MAVTPLPRALGFPIPVMATSRAAIAANAGSASKGTDVAIGDIADADDEAAVVAVEAEGLEVNQVASLRANSSRRHTHRSSSPR